MIVLESETMAALRERIAARFCERHKVGAAACTIGYDAADAALSVLCEVLPAMFGSTFDDTARSAT